MPRILLALCVFLAISCSKREQAPQFEGKRIETLIIRHSTPKYAQDSRILALIRSRPGETYSAEKIDDDIRRVWESGWVDDITFSVEPEGERLHLIATVSTRPGFGPMLFTGNSAFSAPHLFRQVSESSAARISRAGKVRYDLETDEPIPYNDEKLMEEVLPLVCSEVENFYRSNGFPDATVTAKSLHGGSPLNDDFVFVIVEGERE